MGLVLHIQRALYGAWRLALYDPRGARWFEVSIGGFWRSFIAAILVAPLYAMLVATGRGAGTGGEVPPDIGAAGYAVDYFLGWTLFPVVMIFVCRLLDLRRRYVPFIIAYNWSQVIVIAALLPAAYLADRALGGEPAGGALPALLTLVVTVALLFYQWFVARVVLGVPHVTAAAIVILDMLSSLAVDLARLKW